MSVYDKYQPVIGLEVHAQLNTTSKAFCSDDTSYGASPNTNISPISLGHPGTLPRPNVAAVEFAIKMGIACNSEIREYNEFSRKNYFYPDLPKGYQITQFDTPICDGGEIEIEVEGEKKTIRLEHIHLEEDAGKSIHDQDPFYSLIDLNRAGVPLIEIVSRPDIRSGDEAYAYLSEIRKLVRYLEICDGNMEEGSLRCDANISVMLKTDKEFGQRVEVKNMNSIRNVKRAIDHEIKRQIDIIEDGGKIHMATRGFNAVDGTTFDQRSKEQAHDYRYFPEPDIPPLTVTDAFIDEVKSQMPPLPKALKAKFVNEYGLSEYDAGVLTDEKEIALYFNETAAQTDHFKDVANWITGPVKTYLNKFAKSIEEFPLQPKQIVEIIELIKAGKTNFAIASQRLFPEWVNQPTKPVIQLAEEMNLIQESDVDQIQELIDEVIGQFPDKVSAYKNGKKGLQGFFMGQIMKRSGGKADPKMTSKLLEEKLNQ